MERDEQIQMVEMTIEEAKKKIARGDAVMRLTKNRDFKLLVLEGYFVEEAARLALLSGDPTISDATRAHVMRDLTGPSALKRYFMTINQLADMADKALEEGQETLEELHQEQDADGIIVDGDSGSLIGNVDDEEGDD